MYYYLDRNDRQRVKLFDECAARRADLSHQEKGETLLPQGTANLHICQHSKLSLIMFW